MTLSIPLVVILGALVYVLWRYAGLRLWHAVVTALFGFFLAATTVAPDIRRAVLALVQALSAHQ